MWRARTSPTTTGTKAVRPAYSACVADRGWGPLPDVVVTSIDDEPDARPRRAWWRVASSVAALAVAFGLGLGVGRETAGTAPTVTPSAGQSADPGTGASLIRGTGARCAVPTATGLWLGAELVNDGPGVAVLRGARVVLPLGGLRTGGLVWGGCGELRAAAAHGPDAVWEDLRDLPENSSVWISAPFELLEADQCPAPYPVLFRVTYLDRTGRITELEVGFPDLGEVPHPACEGNDL